MEVSIKLVGIFAPASPVPKIEFDLNLEFLAANGVEIVVHPQCSLEHVFFAGTDEERAKAFIDLAYSKAVHIIYGARGGYGSARMLPYIEKAFRKKGRPPKKIMVGYSDMTALNAFASSKWGWSCVHAPMPSLNRFENLKPNSKEELLRLLRGETSAPDFRQSLEPLAGKLKKNLKGPLKGGNLSVLTSMIGTPYFEKFSKNTILFLEDVGESLYRVDRTLLQLHQSGVLKNVAAVVLGTFSDCEDRAPQVLADPEGKTYKPLRAIMTQRKGLEVVFSSFSKATGIPVFAGLNVGHGMDKGIGQDLLWFGSSYQLSKAGHLTSV